MRIYYQERLIHCTQPLAKKLLTIMLRKQSNLCVSADVRTASALLQLVDAVGPAVCMVKTHIDCIDDFTPLLAERLRDLAAQHDFVLFEDRKFADIGATVKAQYAHGVYQIARWADLVNAHPMPGPGIIAGLKAAADDVPVCFPRGLLLIAQMSAQGSLMDQTYIDASVRMAQDHADWVLGFISREAITDDPRFLHMTPGVREDAQSDGLGQQYMTPHEAIVERHTDVIIVGRGITQADDPSAAAEHYRRLGWEAAMLR